MWDLVKNILMVVGGIATIVALWRLFRSRLMLRARAVASRFRPFPTTNEQLQEFVHKIRNASMGTGEAGRLATDLLENLPRDVLIDFGSAPLFQLTDVWEFTIENRGRTEVRDLKLVLDFEGMYTTSRPQSGLVAFEQHIDVGNLRGRDELVVTVWTDSFSSYTSRRNMRVTHADGWVWVDVGEVVHGKVRAVAQFFVNGGWIFLVVLGGFALQAVGAWGQIEEKREMKRQIEELQASQQTTQPTSE